MKQSAVKTIGAVALGAAFAATAAGSASAAPLPDPAGALDTVTQTLPVDEVASQLPAGASDGVTASRSALGTVRQTSPQVLDAVKTANPVGGLLGGLPVNGLAQGGLPVNGIPLGG
ncbi:ATP-binding protein [Streptomyces sp. NBC_00370]|uniref:ATP-binding protein n=1 Tax=Streptomyces sp. NBC_00370 TaxID=2975728 RepID=UPI002E26088C